MTWANKQPHPRPSHAAKTVILKRDPYCRINDAGCTVKATIVDHIVPLAEGGTNEPANLRGVCADCHETKTKQESARGRTRARQGRRAWTRRPTERHPGSL